MYIYEDENQVVTEGLFGDLGMVVGFFKSMKDLKDTYDEVKADKLKNGEQDLSTTTGEALRTFISRIKITEDYIVIKGMDFRKFMLRIKEFYSENNFSKIFMAEYTNQSQKLYKKGKINKKDMEVKYVTFPIFFALEIAMIFEDLGQYYNVPYYKKIAKQIRTKTWVKELDKPVQEVPLNTEKLKNIRYTLKPYQEDFVKMFPTLKNRFHLDGYILSFDQGLGKTLTKSS